MWLKRSLGCFLIYLGFQSCFESSFVKNSEASDLFNWAEPGKASCFLDGNRPTAGGRSGVDGGRADSLKSKVVFLSGPWQRLCDPGHG